MFKRLCIFLAFVTLSAPAFAAPLCVAATADVYTAAGFECEISGAVFANLQYLPMASADLTATDILITPLDLGTSVGLRFSANFVAQGEANGPGVSEGAVAEQYRFLFDVTKPGSNFIAVTTNVTGGSAFSPIPFFPKNSGYAAGVSVSNDGASAIVTTSDIPQSETNPLFNPRPFITLDSITTLTGGADFGTASLRSYEHTFEFADTPVPEPATTLLTGSAVILLFSALRRR